MERGAGVESPRGAREKLRVREVREVRELRGERERGGAEQPFLQ